ncbi:MAG TPA: 50S ribosomal protein L25 [Elusimicrobiales bacterium]|nr:50S ribosomal protein L25 [Elusimicrobiales bacterium]
MQKTMISAEPRENAGMRSKLAAFRAAGKIPAVIYGQDKAPVNVIVDEKEFCAVLKGGANSVITIKHPGGEDTVVIKDRQRHPLTERWTHVDFHRISLTEKIKVKVPVKIVGESYGVKVQTGLVEHTMRELHVLCLPNDIPHEIQLDITELHIGQSLRVRDVKVGKFELMDAPEQIVVSVTAPKEEKVAEPVAGAAVAGAAAGAPGAAAGAEPEVIAKGKKEEEGKEGAAKPEAKKAEPKK